MTQATPTNNGGKKMKALLKQSHDKELMRLEESCMEPMGYNELLNELDRLGYYIDKDMSFDYINRGNEHSYKARSIAIADKVSRKSFANIDTHNDNLKELQEIRRNRIVIHRNRIFEL